MIRQVSHWVMVNYQENVMVSHRVWFMIRQVSHWVMVDYKVNVMVSHWIIASL